MTLVTSAADSLKQARAGLRDWIQSRSEGPMPPGSVLMHAPTAALQAPGGGENQLVQTARHLEAQGCPVRLMAPWSDRLEQATLLHLFGMSHEGLALARVARARRIPVVLSSICWYEPRALWQLAGSMPGRVVALGGWSLKRLAPRRSSWRRELLMMADQILPNSECEARQLRQLFAIDTAKITVIPNGVEARFRDADPGRFATLHPGTDFVLFVGRIEPRKNPLGLIQALRSLGLPLVLIGDAVPGHESYTQACRRAGQGFVNWLPRLEHDDPRLAAAYAAARVFALPSWFETPGLAALEAGLAGCPVVLTPYGCTREYFGDRVEYAAPDDPGAIARAVRTAWDAPRQPDLSAFLASRYLWREVARRTAEVYHAIVA